MKKPSYKSALCLLMEIQESESMINGTNVKYPKDAFVSLELQSSQSKYWNAHKDSVQGWTPDLTRILSEDLRQQ